MVDRKQDQHRSWTECGHRGDFCPSSPHVPGSTRLWTVTSVLLREQQDPAPRGVCGQSPQCVKLKRGWDAPLALSPQAEPQTPPQESGLKARGGLVGLEGPQALCGGASRTRWTENSGSPDLAGGTPAERCRGWRHVCVHLTVISQQFRNVTYFAPWCPACSNPLWAFVLYNYSNYYYYS